MNTSNTSHDTPESNTEHLPRRQFLKAAGLTAAGLGIAGLASSSATAATGDSSSTADEQLLFGVPLDAEGNFDLPPLPYAYDALEPSIDAETMRLHHDIHFKGYMTGLNNALKKLAEARASGDFATVSYWESLLAFNGAGYNLHVVFFQNMAPAGTTSISAELLAELNAAFGSVEGMRGQFSAAAAAVQGSGWAILGYQPFGRKLVILQVEKHQNHTQWGVIPILALDVWEHAYYLKYQNRRGDYINSWWQVVNWDNVARRLAAAKRLS